MNDVDPLAKISFVVAFLVIVLGIFASGWFLGQDKQTFDACVSACENSDREFHARHDNICVCGDTVLHLDMSRAWTASTGE